MAAQRQYGADVSVVPCEEFSDVFAALGANNADAAVVAIENSLYGSINEVYDLLLKYECRIVAELPERIHQCLITHPGTKMEEITHVYSHPVALAQCSDFLHNQLLGAEKTEFYDTAAAVRHIKESNDTKAAAIAGKLAAQLHGMTILQASIENNQQNFTRFLAIERDIKKIPHTNKASLVLQTNNKPGALYKALGIFANRNINMVKLQSRPVPGQVWRYMFYVDIEVMSQELDEVIAELKDLECTVTVLGTYMQAAVQEI
jgi:prephenate dehydratase